MLLSKRYLVGSIDALTLDQICRRMSAFVTERVIHLLRKGVVEYMVYSDRRIMPLIANKKAKLGEFQPVGLRREFRRPIDRVKNRRSLRITQVSFQNGYCFNVAAMQGNSHYRPNHMDNNSTDSVRKER